VPQAARLRRRFQEPYGRSRRVFAQRGLTKRSLEKLSENSRTCLQGDLTGHRDDTFQPIFGLCIPAKSTVGVLLKALFGQFLEDEFSEVC
jgi:hypothetical protein